MTQTNDDTPLSLLPESSTANVKQLNSIDVNVSETEYKSKISNIIATLRTEYIDLTNDLLKNKSLSSRADLLVKKNAQLVTEQELKLEILNTKLNHSIVAADESKKNSIELQRKLDELTTKICEAETEQLEFEESPKLFLSKKRKFVDYIGEFEIGDGNLPRKGSELSGFETENQLFTESFNVNNNNTVENSFDCETKTFNVENDSNSTLNLFSNSEISSKAIEFFKSQANLPALNSESLQHCQQLNVDNFSHLQQRLGMFQRQPAHGMSQKQYQPMSQQQVPLKENSLDSQNLGFGNQTFWLDKLKAQVNLTSKVQSISPISEEVHAETEVTSKCANHFIPSYPTPPSRHILSVPKGDACVHFQLGNCYSENCHFEHYCVRCTGPHPLFACNSPRYICIKWNMKECGDLNCVREHRCLKCCDKGHFLVNCIAPEKKAPGEEFCFNWNVSAYCKTVNCRRSHACLRCTLPHPSTLCPRNINQYIRELEEKRRAMCPFSHLQNETKFTKEQEHPSLSEVKLECKNFNSINGCKYGNACKFQHNTTASKDQKIDRSEEENEAVCNSKEKKLLESSLKVVITKRVPSENVKNTLLPQIEGSAPLKAKREIVKKPVIKLLQEKLMLTKDPIDQAKLKQKIEIGQLEKRFPNNIKVNFNDGIGYEINFTLIPTDPDFPFFLESKGLLVGLFVDTLYPISYTTLKILNKEIPLHLIKNIENTFNLKAARVKMTLLQLINYLDRDLESLLSMPDRKSDMTFISNEKKDGDPSEGAREVASDLLDSASNLNIAVTKATEDTSLDTGVTQKNDLEVKENCSGHKGIQIKFLNVKLENISSLKLQCLNLGVKCVKCKNENIIKNLKSNTANFFYCTYCGEELGCRFRPVVLDLKSRSVGYLDFVNCTAYQLLPLNFLPTCLNCSNDNKKFFFKDFSVDDICGPNFIFKNCEKCFSKMNLSLSNAKFVNLAPTNLDLHKEYHDADITGLKANKLKKNLDGLVLGVGLPKNGTCKHYRKSYRWFRFPCCSKLFACMDCHNSNSTCLESSLACRIICGYCSKEQRYDPKNSICISCLKDTSKSSKENLNMLKDKYFIKIEKC
ncbi:hypothetical protein HDU92_002076 [Lobulomyces angularis]|nr:hypothetical protein HDU92_002076 [Lobulomyces angularis]